MTEPDAIRRTLLMAAALGLLAVITLARQGPSEDDTGPFLDVVNVNVVNVEVFVTDRQGQAVTGLTVDDFELFEDGRPVTITNFYAVADGVATTEPAPEALEPASPAAPPRPGARPPVPEDQRLHLILYFDNFFLKPFSRQRVIREVRGFLASALRPDDRVMVLSYERTLHVRQPFTSDLASVHDALSQIETLTGYAVQDEAERDQVLKAVGRSRRFEEAEPVVDAYAKARYNDLSRAIGTLKDLVGPLAGLPGRKALLYVSDGVPMVAAADLYELLDQKFGNNTTGKLRSLRYSARDRFRELVASANANRVTFYTLEARGLRSHSSLSAASGTGATSGGSLIEVDMARDFNLQEPLQMMAHDTGGLAAISTNNIAGALERMSEDFGSYYSLGYDPGHLGGGRAHTIKVEVKGKGLSVRHRRSYRDKSFETRLTEGVLAALRYGGGGNPLELRLEASTGSPRDDGHFLVPLTVKVPFRRVTLLPRDGRHQGRLRLVMAVLDADGGTAVPEAATLPLDIPDAAIEEVRRQDVVYSVELLMRRGQHQIAVGLRDEMSGETAIVRREVSVE